MIYGVLPDFFRLSVVFYIYFSSMTIFLITSKEAIIINLKPSM